MADKERELLLAEYCALREELLKRIETKYQFASFALIALGTLVGIGFQVHDASLIMIYPILALFLLTAHISNSFEMDKITDYIKDEVESKVGTDNIGWEHYKCRPDIDRYDGVVYSGVRATLVVSGWISIVVALTVIKYDTKGIVLLILDGVSAILLLVLAMRQALLFKIAMKMKRFYKPK